MVQTRAPNGAVGKIPTSTTYRANDAKGFPIGAMGSDRMWGFPERASWARTPLGPSNSSEHGCTMITSYDDDY